MTTSLTIPKDKLPSTFPVNSDDRSVASIALTSISLRSSGFFLRINDKTCVIFNDKFARQFIKHSDGGGGGLLDINCFVAARLGFIDIWAIIELTCAC